MKPQLLNILSGTWNRHDPTKNTTFWWAILTLCIFSRILTTIYYIEDVDSLRFALSIKDYDLSAYQPHFPAYPVYCFIVKLFYAVTGGKLAISFSIVGGLSIFGVIYFTIAIYRLLFTPLTITTNAWLALLLFLNPLLWLMGNRYMPDLMGLALLLGCIYLFIIAWVSLGDEEEKEGTTNESITDQTQLVNKINKTQLQGQLDPLGKENLNRWHQTYKPYYLWSFYVALGLLIGVRISYLPFLLVPTFALTATFIRRLPQLLFFGILGVLLWFIPLLIDTGGWDALLQVAQKHLNGHFNEWGGTVKTESGYWLRIVRIVQYTWADGIGGYWLDRHWLLIVFSLLLYAAFGNYKRFARRFVSLPTPPAPQELSENQKRLLILRTVINLCLLCYFIWIFFFQNVLYKSRHIMPFIPFIVARIAIGIGQNDRYFRTGIAILLIPLNIYITSTLVRQHRHSTAIAQIKDFMVEQNKPQNTFYAPELVAFYMKRQYDWKVNFVYSDKPDALKKLAKRRKKGGKVYSLIDLNKVLKQKAKVRDFYHNPYVNRMWSELKVFEYK